MNVKKTRGGAINGATSTSAPGITVVKGAILLATFILGCFFVGGLLLDGQYAFAMLFAIVITAGLLTFGLRSLYPHRYIFPGVAGMVIFIIFPLVYTIYISFTNYSAKNLFTIERAWNYHADKTYRVPGGDFKFDILKRDGDNYSIALTKPAVINEDGSVTPAEYYISDPTKMIGKDELQQSEEKKRAAKQKEFHMNKVDTFPGTSCGLKCKIEFRDYLKLVKVKLENFELSPVDLHNYAAIKKKFKKVNERILSNGIKIEDKYLLFDNETKKIFAPDRENGYYRYVDDENGEFFGDNYTPGFRVGVGLYHFKRIVSDPNISEPFVKIFIWTVCFAGGTVFITLAIGMILACLVQWEFLKGRAIYRVFLILPYAVPSFISILVFKGLFNENFGEINKILDYFFGIKPDWFNEPGLARSMLLIVNAWLGYPYMMILCMGLLKSIPEDLYEASAMDGANPFTNFFKITLPLLMKPLTPLLIASFAFNFNNFVLIMLLTNGGPDFLPEAGSTTASMAGATDLLVSYTYRLAFEGGAGGNDYGLASAIATAIFVLVGALSVINLKLSKMSAKD
jgi:maltose/maltodextrin transport system permease protein